MVSTIKGAFKYVFKEDISDDKKIQRLNRYVKRVLQKHTFTNSFTFSLLSRCLANERQTDVHFFFPGCTSLKFSCMVWSSYSCTVLLVDFSPQNCRA